MTPVVALPALTAEELEFLAFAIDRRCGHLDDLLTLRLTDDQDQIRAQASIGRSLLAAVTEALAQLAGS